MAGIFITVVVLGVACVCLSVKFDEWRNNRKGPGDES
jgi:hypothetical protein